MAAALLDPPHGTPLPPLVFSLDAKALVETVQWLCDRVKEHHSDLAQVSQLVQKLQDEERKRAGQQGQKEELLTERFEMLERLMLRGASSYQAREAPVDAGTGAQQVPDAAVSGERQDEKPLERSMERRPTLARRASNLPENSNSADSGQVLREVELQVATCQMNLKKLEQYVRHQEQQQTARDNSQDELLKLELQKLQREIDGRLKDKDLEPLRSLVTASSQKITLEVQEQVQSMSSALKGTMHAQLGDIQSTLEKIASSTQEQVRLLDDKVERISADEMQRHQKSSREVSDVRSEVLFLAEHLGISEDQLEAAAQQARLQEDGADGAERRASGGGLVGARLRPATPGGGAADGELVPRVANLEEGLRKLAIEVGAPLGTFLSGVDAGTPSGGGRLVSRVQTLEAKVEDLSGGEPSGGKGPRKGGAGSRQAQPLPQRVEMVEAKMDEVAAAMGINPLELEAAALADERGGLAGRLMLREEVEAVSPRMAGIIAAQEDRIVDLDNHLRRLDARMAVLEDLEGAVAAAAGGTGGLPTDLQQLERRLNSAGTGEGGAESSQGSKAGAGRPTTSESQDSTGPGEVRHLKRDVADLRRKLDGLLADLAKGKFGGAAPDQGKARRDDERGGSKEATEFEHMQRAEKAAKVAEAAAAAASKLRAELEEIVRAVEVPSAAAAAGFFDEISPSAGGSDGRGHGLSEKEQADATAEYVERQMALERRLHQLEEQLESASMMQPDGEVFRGLKTAIKDIRQCLARCELLFQLPEIRIFVKRFQSSLRVNAMLHERWVGPGAGFGKAHHPDDSGEGHLPSPSGRSGTGAFLSSGEHTKSAPDLSMTARSRRESAAGKRGGADTTKKKPFRTVVDWCRPHTPLKIDPAYGGRPTNAGPHSTRKHDDVSPDAKGGMHLPQIVAKV